MQINPSPTAYNLGGKGYQLFLLNEICSVPEFFVIRFEYDDEIENDEVQAEITRTFDSHMFNYVSVRSSATVEDSDVASFAGMFQTKLNVTRDNLIGAIKEVLYSSRNTRVHEYCELHGLDASAVQVRVIIQRMVNSKVAGVCITKDIGNPDTMLIEACWGLGEALVSGMIAPDIYKVNRMNLEIVSFKIGYQNKMVAPYNRTETVDVLFHLRNAKKLKSDELLALTKMCLLIEMNLNYGTADIEWAFEGDKLYILQARPFIGRI